MPVRGERSGALAERPHLRGRHRCEAARDRDVLGEDRQGIDAELGEDLLLEAPIGPSKQLSGICTVSNGQSCASILSRARLGFA